MIEFIQDDDRLREERKKAKKNKDKYVGMSSDAMGFRSKGFSSFDGGMGSSGGGGGWKDDWNRSNSNPSGFRDHSEDEGSREHSPVPEFRDDDNDFSSPPRPASAASGASKKFSDLAPSQPVSSQPSSSVSKAAQPATRTTKTIKKPIDLGAAASFAAQASNNPPKAKEQPNAFDLFGEPNAGAPPVAAASQSSVNFLGGEADDEDDFNPRGSDSANANGDFGNFEAAFGEASSNNGATTNNGTDSFADFSSAFGATGAEQAASASVPRPPSRGAQDLDLMGSGGGGGFTSSASNMDLLGGLVMNNAAPPPLVGMSSLGGSGAMSSMNSQLFNQPTVMDSPAHQFGPSPMLMTAKSNNNNHNATSSANAASSAANKKATMWDNVGNVNINLDNLSLKGGNNKKSGLPMNALVTPTSSPQKAAMGSGMMPPPLKSVQGSQPASQSSFDLGDLLN